MDRQRLIDLYPTAYHMADAENWPSIARHGLLSTSALLDRFGSTGPARDAIESALRPGTMAIPAGVSGIDLGVAFARDQAPLDPEALEACLEGMTVPEWLRLLNGRVFFWADAARLDRMFRCYHRREQAVFEVDTRRLLDRHGGRVEVSRINSGFAAPLRMNRANARRGAGTFVPLAEFAHDSRNKVVELTVVGGVPDILEIVTRVTGRLRGRADRVLWEP